MKDGKISILISGSPGPRFHLYREALIRPEVTVTDGYLPVYDDSCDGLMLAGGCDVSPELYGEKDNGSKNCDMLRDRCEIELLRKFTEAGKPIFGICRGIQIMNVFFGGTLIGDLPESPMHHSSKEKIYHNIITEKDNIMRDLFGADMRVNSFHHQAVKDTAKDFIVTARSTEDGIAEAMEHKTEPWFAVQFHPERMLNGDCPVDDAKPLFDHFISLCRK